MGKRKRKYISRLARAISDPKIMVITWRRFYWYFYSLSFALLLLLSLSAKSSQWILTGINAQHPMGLTIHVHHSRTYHDSSRYDDMNKQVSDIDNDIPQSIIPNVTIQFEPEMLQRIEQQERNGTNESYDIFDVSYIEFVLHEYIQSTSSIVSSSSPSATTTTTRSHIFYKSTASYRIKKSSVIDIEDTTTINNETVWFGSTITSAYDNSSDNNIMGFCSLYSLGGIIQSGTFTTDDATYDLIYFMTNQSYIIRSTFLVDYPPHEINDDDDYLNQTYSFDDNNNNNAINEASRIQYPSLVSINPNENEIVTDWIDVQGPAAMMYNNPSDDPSQSKSSSTNVVIDVLVIVTNRAMCEYGRRNSTTPSFPYCSVTVENYTPIQNKIFQVIAETNNAMRYVNVEIRLKQIQYFVDDGSRNNVTGYDPIATGAWIQSVRDNKSIQQSRIDQGADLVAVIAGAGGGNCGIAVSGGYISLTNHRCFSGYSFTHEIGHNLGCNHNRESCPSTKRHPYAHAYRDLVNLKYSTIVAYGCGNGEKQCPRIPYYSSSVITLPDGRILGDALNDNLRAISANAPRVASYQKAIPPPPSPPIIIIPTPPITVPSPPSPIIAKPPISSPVTTIPSPPNTVPAPPSPTIAGPPVSSPIITIPPPPITVPSTDSPSFFEPPVSSPIITISAPPITVPSTDSPTFIEPPVSSPINTISAPPIIVPSTASPTTIVIIPPQPTNIVLKPPVSSPPVAICFSSINTVVVKDIGDIPLPELQIGDYVKTYHDDETYTQVYGFGHYDYDREELFLRMTFNSNHDFVIDTNSKNNNNNHHDDISIEKHHYTNDVEITSTRYLEISQNHLIFVKRNGQQKIPIRALDVVVGDQISDNRQIVTSIERIKRRGVYAPLTQSGELFVSGVHVSNYVNMFDITSNKDNNNNTIIIFNQHKIGHILFTPQRMFCQYYIETCKKEYYINGYGLLAYMIISSANIIKYMIEIMSNIINIIQVDYLIERITSIPQFVRLLLLIPIIGTVTILRIFYKEA